jgi:hypothetical protein
MLVNAQLQVVHGVYLEYDGLQVRREYAFERELEGADGPC